MKLNMWVIRFLSEYSVRLILRLFRIKQILHYLKKRFAFFHLRSNRYRKLLKLVHASSFYENSFLSMLSIFETHCLLRSTWETKILQTFSMLWAQSCLKFSFPIYVNLETYDPLKGICFKIEYALACLIKLI